MNSWSDRSPSPEISGQHGIYAVFCWPFFPMRDLWMWGMTPAGKENIGEIKCFMQRSLWSAERYFYRMCSIQVAEHTDTRKQVRCTNNHDTKPWEKIIPLWNCQLTSSSNCCLDKGVQLLVTTDGQLQVTGSDTLHLQVFGGVARQL